MHNRPFVTQIRYHIAFFVMRYFVSIYELERLCRLVRWCSFRELTLLDKAIMKAYDNLEEDEADKLASKVIEIAENAPKRLPKKGQNK